jgi:hypothetical protein
MMERGNKKKSEVEVWKGDGLPSAFPSAFPSASLFAKN